MNILSKTALVLAISLPIHFLMYLGFSTTFCDDVDFGYGQKKWKNRKKCKDFWKKLFFIDIKDYIKKWHYVCFWINCIAFIPMVISIICYSAYHSSVARYVGLVFAGIYLGAEVLPSLTYWPLYRGNVVRSKRKYRRNREKNR